MQEQKTDHAQADKERLQRRHEKREREAASLVLVKNKDGVEKRVKLMHVAAHERLGFKLVPAVGGKDKTKGDK